MISKCFARARFRCLLLVLPLFDAGLLAQDTTNFPSLGEIVRLDPALDALIPGDAKIEVLASGFEWSEGPVWISEEGHPHGGYLLFSDIPNNAVMRWDEGTGARLYLQPSGYTGVSLGIDPPRFTPSFNRQ